MEIKHERLPWEAGDAKVTWIEGFDFVLFRRDWGGTESVYFTESEMKKVKSLIRKGEIMVHGNYSILHCRTPELVAKYERIWRWCCVTG